MPLPTPTANQTAIVYHVGYPTVDVDVVSTIANFPDEAEYLVVLYTAIKVAESAMVTEEDPELFAPIITVLKQDYVYVETRSQINIIFRRTLRL